MFRKKLTSQPNQMQHKTVVRMLQHNLRNNITIIRNRKNWKINLVIIWSHNTLLRQSISMKLKIGLIIQKGRTPSYEDEKIKKLRHVVKE